MQLHEMSKQTHDRLVGSGLDPNYVADIIRHTIAEDLDGGIDVTSVATVPLAQRSIATFGARAHGCVFARMCLLASTHVRARARAHTQRHARTLVRACTHRANISLGAR